MLIRKNRTWVVKIILFFAVVILFSMFIPMFLFSGVTLEKMLQRFVIDQFPIKFGGSTIVNGTIFEIMLAVIFFVSCMTLVPYLAESLELKDNKLIHSKLLEKGNVINVDELISIYYTESLKNHVLTFNSKNASIQIIGANFYKQSELRGLIKELTSKNKTINLNNCQELLK
ncbi:MAG: hypothetical protein Q7S22_03295 [Candidatus Micrarchaeota archaeon]|nr:hypothetical protein [Candidatus Micrarchaeota archaeon]